MNHTLNHTACRILLLHTCHKSIFCLCRRFQIRHIQWTLADITAVCTLWIDHNTGNLLAVRINLNSQCPKHFQCHSTSGNTSDRLPTGGTATTAIISKSIFLIKRIVCVPRAMFYCIPPWISAFPLFSPQRHLTESLPDHLLYEV